MFTKWPVDALLKTTYTACVPVVGVMPAVRNAIRHALGLGIDTLPITPARILEALAARKTTVDAR